jgi:hypothetical protein
MVLAGTYEYELLDTRCKPGKEQPRLRETGHSIVTTSDKSRNNIWKRKGES